MSLFGRCLLAFCLIFAVPLMAQPSGDDAWFYKGSDIPKDPDWQFGSLPNGLHYVVRRNALPAGQVSIRVRIAAGALHEEESERGWAHLVEHLVFRGTKSFDGKEAEHILQQLGARPGGDTNASTGPDQTIYQLDLPKNDRESINKGLNILSEMVDSARFDPVAVDSERKIVMAERSARLTQNAVRIDEVLRPHFYAGLKFAKHDIIGNEATLATASPEALRAFYERWYRPDRATVIVVGDADPAMLAELLASHFGGWQPSGPKLPNPDYGVFTLPRDITATLVAAGSPYEARVMWHRPFVDRPSTVERARFYRTRALAQTIINRRLEARARENGPFLVASLQASNARYIGDTTTLVMSARDGRWNESLQEVFAILADALRTPPDAAEIERELSNIRSASQAMVRQDSTRPSPFLASLIIGALEAGPQPTSAVGLEQFEAFARQLTPAQVADATKAILSGVGPQIMLLSPSPVEGGAPAVTAALASAGKAAPAKRPQVHSVTMDALPKLGPPGKETSRQRIEDMDVTIVRFANGSSLVFKQTNFTKGSVNAQLRIGDGLASMPTQRPPGWLGATLTNSGIGNLNFGDVQQLFTGRRVGLSMGLSEDGLMMLAGTSPEDLADQLRLFALQIAFPRWDDNAFNRQKTAVLQSYDRQNFESASARAGRETAAVTHAGDPRFAPWEKEKTESLTPAEYRRMFEPLLATGSLELVIVGDVGLEQAVAAAAASIGALPPRPANGPFRAAAVPRADSKPQIFTHRGDPGEAYAMIGWSNPGFGISHKERRALATAQNILRTRLTDRLRQELGATYTVGVTNQFSPTFNQWGAFVITAQVKPENADAVFRIAREEMVDLARRPVAADEFERAQNPAATSLERDMKTNGYWTSALLNWTTRPDVIDMYRGRLERLKSITSEDVRAAVAAQVMDEGDWSMLVLPEKKTAKSD